MSKFIVFLLITVFAISSVHAQNKPLGKKQLNWGIKSGLNISTLQMDDMGNADKTNWKAGFVFGAFFRIRGGPNFMFQPEFLYSSMGSKSESSLNGDATYRLNYFSIPLLANYRFSNKWNAVLGPQFDFLILGKNVSGSDESEVTDSYEDHSLNITGGAEFWPSDKFGFSARYIHGMNDISKDNSSIKNQGFQFTVAVKL